MFLIKCKNFVRPVSVFSRNLSISSVMSTQEKPVRKAKHRPQSGHKNRHSGNKKFGPQNKRHIHNQPRKTGWYWPSKGHKCIKFYHSDEMASVEDVIRMVSPFGTVIETQQQRPSEGLITVVEMSTSSEAEKAWSELIKSLPQGILKVMPDMNNMSILRYQPYWDENAINMGLEDGSLLKGNIRISPRMYHLAFISDGKNSDILLNSMIARNRALPGDNVAVKLRPQSEWVVNGKKPDVTEAETSKMLENLDISDTTAASSKEAKGEQQKEIQRTGDVVGILEKNHSRVCAGTLSHVRADGILFSPTDSCLPRLLIPKEQCPSDFVARPSDYKNKLFIAKILEWDRKSMFASGELCQFIGNSGEIEPETKKILVEHGVDHAEFPPTINDSLPSNLPWTIPQREYEVRRDLRSECIFTIDPATAKDLDDALHCKKIGENLFEVGVHIADVSYFVKPKTEVDEIASRRCTSVYLVQRVIPMLPNLLCEELCSLNPGQDRLTYSVIWKITGEGRIKEEWFGRTVIHSCTKMSYDHAQSLIDALEDSDVDPEMYPPIDGNHNLDTIRNKVLHLFHISQNLRKKRYEDGALRLDQIRLAYTLDKETDMPNSCFTYDYKQSNELIEEFMLLANIAVANKLQRSLPSHAFLRCHPEPKEDMLKSVGTLCQNNGLQLDITSAKSLAASLRAAAGDDDLAIYRLQGLHMLAIKPQELAIYFCAGCVKDEEKYRHYALNVPLYTHFTSPIRRYADIIVHRQLSAALGDTRDVELANLEPSDLQKQADDCNNRKSISKKVQDLSVHLFFCELLKTVGVLESEAIVLAVFDHSFDILPIKFGQVYRVYANNLPIVGFKEKKPELEILWPCDGTERYKLTDEERKLADEGKLKMPKYSETIKQTIGFFSIVDAVFEIGSNPLKVKAYIRRKAD